TKKQLRRVTVLRPCAPLSVRGLVGGWAGGRLGCERMAAQIELERARHCGDRFRPGAVLQQRELERRRVGDGEPAGQAVLLLRDPAAAAVLADHEVRGGLGPGNHGGLSWLTLAGNGARLSFVAKHRDVVVRSM